MLVPVVDLLRPYHGAEGGIVFKNVDWKCRVSVEKTHNGENPRNCFGNLSGGGVFGFITGQLEGRVELVESSDEAVVDVDNKAEVTVTSIGVIGPRGVDEASDVERTPSAQVR